MKCNPQEKKSRPLKKTINFLVYFVFSIYSTSLWADTVDQTLELMQNYVNTKNAEQNANKESTATPAPSNKSNISPATPGAVLPYAPAPLMITPGIKPPSLLPEPNNTSNKSNTSPTNSPKTTEQPTKTAPMNSGEISTSNTPSPEKKPASPENQPSTKPAQPKLPPSPWLQPNPWQNTQQNPWDPHQQQK